jgi:hypothetical protein
MLVPDIDVAAGTVTFAIWQLMILIGSLLLVLLLAIYRARWAEAVPRVLGPVVRIGLLLLAVAAAWSFLDRTAERDRADERHALDRRIAELSARASAPGSPLACLHGSLTEAVLAACEKAIFASPETAAAATAFVADSLALLSDGLAYGVDPEYDAALAALRGRLETDPFGFVAQVLARQGCSAAKCEKFALFADTSRISAHLKARTLEALVARHSGSWAQSAASAVPGAAAGAAAPAAAPVASLPPAPPSQAPTTGSSINFPSAASIPPISIMTEEPSLPGSTGSVPPPGAGLQKRPAPAAAPGRPARAQTQPPPPPIPIGPPVANAGTESPPQ